MFMFHTQKLHSFTQNYIMIIVWILLNCKSYVLHIKTSQVEKKYHLYKNNMNVFFAIFTFKNLWIKNLMKFVMQVYLTTT